MAEENWGPVLLCLSQRDQSCCRERSQVSTLFVGRYGVRVSVCSVQIISCVWTLKKYSPCYWIKYLVLLAPDAKGRSPRLLPGGLRMPASSLIWVDCLGCLLASELLPCGFCKSFLSVAKTLPRSIFSVNSMKEPCPDPGLFTSVDLAREQVLVIKKLIWADGER